MRTEAIRRSTVRRVHLAASTGALLIVASFLGATLAVETVGDESDVASVKHWIARALVVFVPVVVVAAITGRRLAGRSRGPIVSRKLRRNFRDGMRMRAQRARGRRAAGAQRAAATL